MREGYPGALRTSGLPSLCKYQDQADSRERFKLKTGGWSWVQALVPWSYGDRVESSVGSSLSCMTQALNLLGTICKTAIKLDTQSSWDSGATNVGDELPSLAHSGLNERQSCHPQAVCAQTAARKTWGCGCSAENEL